MATRFQDDGRTIWEFTDDILVECPRCGACAHILPKDPRDARYSPYFSPRRVTCLACGYARDAASTSAMKRQPNARPRQDRASRAGASGASRQRPVDTFLGLPLYLQTPCAGHIFWALNPRHLAWVESFLAADLREDAAPERHKTAVSVLPHWLIGAHRRDEARRAAARLREKLLG